MLSWTTESPINKDGCLHSIFFMTSNQRHSFWEWATKHRARGHRSAQSESWFFPSLHSVRCHVHHLPPQTHLSFIDLTQKAFHWKMFWIKQYISIASLKSKSERYSFTLFYSVSILNFIQLKTPSVTLISLNLFFFFFRPTSPSTSASWLINK